MFFLELLSAVEPRVVNWNLVTKDSNRTSSTSPLFIRVLVLVLLVIEKNPASQKKCLFMWQMNFQLKRVALVSVMPRPENVGP